jgi:NAD+ synthase
MRPLHARKSIEHIVSWLKTYCTDAGLKGFVVGVSGGIDSALTSTLCAETGLDLIVLNMPIYQALDQRGRSNDHIDWLTDTYPNVKGQTIDLTPIFKAMEDNYPKDIQDDLSMANARARLRMTTLYTFAGHEKMLVAGTGNKVEDFGVGFFTKYGDGGVDLSPIADLYKSEVYALARELGVNQEILDAAPTDGLWGDDRTDEDQIGASYDELEWAMEYLRLNKEVSALSGREAEVMKLYQRLNRINQHKMVPIPVCEIPDELRVDS